MLSLNWCLWRNNSVFLYRSFLFFHILFKIGNVWDWGMMWFLTFIWAHNICFTLGRIRLLFWSSTFLCSTSIEYLIQTIHSLKYLRRSPLQVMSRLSWRCTRLMNLAFSSNIGNLTWAWKVGWCTVSHIDCIRWDLFLTIPFKTTFFGKSKVFCTD
jgi:hypothetical protein